MCKVQSVKCGVWSVTCRVWSAKCKVQSVPNNAAPVTQNDILHSTGLRYPPATQNGTFTMFHACHAICTLSPLHTALTMRFTKDTQHDSSKMLHLPRKMKMDTFNILRQPRKMQLIFWKRCKSIAPVTENDFRHHLQTCENVTTGHTCHAKRH